MGPAWVLSAPNGPRVGPMNLAIRVYHTCENLIHIPRSVIPGLCREERLNADRLGNVVAVWYRLYHIRFRIIYHMFLHDLVFVMTIVKQRHHDDAITLAFKM